jgi:hypothetical protein
MIDEMTCKLSLRATLFFTCVHYCEALPFCFVLISCQYSRCSDVLACNHLREITTQSETILTGGPEKQATNFHFIISQCLQVRSNTINAS